MAAWFVVGLLSLGFVSSLWALVLPPPYSAVGFIITFIFGLFVLIGVMSDVNEHRVRSFADLKLSVVGSLSLLRSWLWMMIMIAAITALIAIFANVAPTL